MTIAATAIGGLLIFITIIDVFQTLFHPGIRGALNDWIARGIWKVFRTIAVRWRKTLTYAGPFAILLTIVCWTVLTWFGFALIYFPRLQYGFAYNSSIASAQSGGFTEALNVSLGALITISQGVTPKLGYLRFLYGFEAVMGFGLLTASVSWLLSIYPVLESRRSVAERATLMHNSEIENNLDVTDSSVAHSPDWLIAISSDLVYLRNQFAQFPIAYYFHIGEEKTSLSGALSYLLELSERATTGSKEPAMRAAGTVLGGAVHNFLELIAQEFLSIPEDNKQAILHAYARQQMTDLLLRHKTLTYPRQAA
jgi:hypothetical protein